MSLQLFRSHYDNTQNDISEIGSFLPTIPLWFEQIFSYLNDWIKISKVDQQDPEYSWGRFQQPCEVEFA